MPEDLDRIIEAQELAFRRQAPLPPELLELNDRLQAAIARQSEQLVQDYWREREESRL